MAEYLQENSPVLQLPIKCLMAVLHTTLYTQILWRIGCIIWALDVIWMPTIATIRLNALVWVKCI